MLIMENRNVVGFTGTQRGMTNEQCIAVHELVERLKPVMVHHGGCVGADIDFDEICFRLQIDCTIHPSDIKRMQGMWHYPTYLRDEHPPLERNHHIVDESSVLIAAPKSKREEVRSGTWSTVRYALRSKKPVVIVHNNGGVDLRGPILAGPIYQQLYDK